MMTFEAFAADTGTALKTTRIHSRPGVLTDYEHQPYPDLHEQQTKPKHWLCLLTTRDSDHAYCFAYTQGSAHRKAPTVEDVLDSLRCDLTTLDEGDIADQLIAFADTTNANGIRDGLRALRACEQERDDLTQAFGYKWLRGLLDCDAL